MIARPASVLLLSAFLAGIGTARAQPLPDPRVADLVQAGTIRVGLFATQFTKDPVTGDLQGVRPDIARALAARIGVKAVLQEYGEPPEVVACIGDDACDLVFLPRDRRAEGIADFSYPFIQSEFTLLLPQGSAIRSAADADRRGIRISAVRTHASTASLADVMHDAELVLEDSEGAAFALLRAGRVDAFASTRQLLLRFSPRLPGSRVLTDHYGAQLNRLVIPKGHPGRLAFLNEFVEEAKASGLVQRAIDRAGASAFAVAPPGDLEPAAALPN